MANTLAYDLDNKPAVVGADLVFIADSEASNVNKEATITAVMELAAGTVGTSSIENTDGVLKVDIGNTTAATEPTTAYKVLVDVSGVNKAVTVQNLAKPIGEVFAGTNATSGLSEVDGVGRVNINGVDAKTTPIAADAIIINDSADTNKNKKVTLANMAAFYGAIAQMPVDIASSLFFHAVEVDFGVATAVDTKITDAAAAKGKLLLAIGVVTEAFNGDADNTITISNNTLLGANPMCSNIVVDKDAAQNGNWLASMLAGMPVAGADATVAASADIYAYSAANTNRSAGKMYFFLVLQKTA